MKRPGLLLFDTDPEILLLAPILSRCDNAAFNVNLLPYFYDRLLSLGLPLFGREPLLELLSNGWGWRWS